MAWTQEQINEVYAKVQRTAMTDEEFRAELLADAGAAIEKLTGEKLPEDFKVKVVENDPQYAATFVLPPMVSDELSDEELDSVAGGTCFVDGGSVVMCRAESDPLYNNGK